MAGSMKDALRKSGLTPDEPKQARAKKKFLERLEELPDDQSLPPPFEAPALTEARVDPLPPKKP